MTITVTGENSPPVANPDTATTTAPQPVTIDVLANDTDPDGDVLQVVFPVGVPANGSSGIDRSDLAGKVVYQPNAGFVGADTFTYTVSDGETTSIGNVTVTVLAARENSPPVANDDSATTTEGTTVAIDVLANDTDPDGDLLILDSSGSAANGTVVVDLDASLVRYTPNPGFVGVDTFSYEMNDGDRSDNGIVTVTVTAADPDPDPTSPTDPTPDPKATEPPTPTQPAAKPTAKPTAAVTTLPATGTGTALGSEGIRVLLALVAVGLTALGLCRRFFARRRDGSA